MPGTESHPSPSREVVSTAKAPKAIGPYSQGIKAGDLLFTAGEAGVDPASGRLVEGGITAQTRQALENIRAILEAAGSSPQRVVKRGVFSPTGRFQAANAVYAAISWRTRPRRARPCRRRSADGRAGEIDAVAPLA
jgi:2-iminobutanoate/2-iminopropanoate deaminase